jgi:Uma2 family endonuclease
MGAKAGISVSEYLHTSFPDLDRVYRDGALVERSLPDYLHGRTQILLGVFFEALRKRLSLFASSETRMKLRDGLILIPDVSVFWPAPPAGVPDSPPLIVIEILSPDDRMSAVLEKLDEFRKWGVAHVWLVDPHARRMYTYEAELAETARLQIPAMGVELNADDIFE